jgi:KipI family sensor histidine kinase inhibitor
MNDFRLLPLGDSCLSVVFEEKIDPSTNARCVAMADALDRTSRRGIRDVVPGYNTVAVYFDPLQLDRRSVASELELLAAAHANAPAHMGPLVEIPVRYGGAPGPDLPAVADFARCSEDEVVRLHSSTEYRVYMLGFLPGFAYLASVDQRIAMPRLDTPRMRVQAGSIGIAGRQTGIYPCDTPGGWRIIGRTEIKIFNAAKPDPFLFQPGQRVKFVVA